MAIEIYNNKSIYNIEGDLSNSIKVIQTCLYQQNKSKHKEFEKAKPLNHKKEVKLHT